MAEPLSANQHTAGRQALDAFLQPLIDATPWLYRSRVQEYLNPTLRDQIVETVGVAVRDTQPGG